MSKQITVLDTRVVTGTGGGPDKTILNSPRYLSQGGYRMLCAYMHHPFDTGFDQLRARAAASGAVLISVPDQNAIDYRVIKHLYKICRQENVAIWHAHDYKSNILGLFLKYLWPMRLVTTVHGWVRHTSRTSLYYAVDRFSLRFYERVICVSDDLHRRCLESRVPAARCLLIENGIDQSSFRRRVSVSEAKWKLGLDPKRLLVGAIGRLSQEKGFDHLIQCADRLLQHGHDFDLVIAGDGDQHDALAALIQSSGRGDKIRLLGYTDDPLSFFEAMDIFALSSSREGLPNVLLEAMVLGIPVISTRVGGVGRLIEDGENGLLVEPDEPDHFDLGLSSLLTDCALRDRLGRMGRERVVESFGFERRMEKIRTVYDELLGVPPTARLSGAMPS